MFVILNDFSSKMELSMLLCLLKELFECTSGKVTSLTLGLTTYLSSDIALDSTFEYNLSGVPFNSVLISF